MARVLSPLTWDVSQKETVVPLSGPPKSWIQPHGTTPGCIACKQRESKGTLHGRVHGKNCKQRYKEFLEQELRKRRERERESSEKQLLPPPKRADGKRLLPGRMA